MFPPSQIQKAVVVVLALALSTVAIGNTPKPTSVTVSGDFQSELGAPGDWMPDATATRLTYDANDDVWQGIFLVPAGTWQYKVALNGAWDENYGLHATPSGANIAFSLPVPTLVKFYYDHKSHWITDSVTSTIAVVPGSFQSELGAAGDWQPDCLRSWLQDVDGDGLYGFVARGLPTGSFEARVALDESWTVSYGPDGVQGGANFPFTVSQQKEAIGFAYDSSTHVMRITSPADINGSGSANAVDIQLAINAVLGFPIVGAFGADVDGDGAANAVDIQLVVNAVLGIP